MCSIVFLVFTNILCVILSYQIFESKTLVTNHHRANNNLNTTTKHMLVIILMFINHQNPKSPNWGLDAFNKEHSLDHVQKLLFLLY